MAAQPNPPDSVIVWDKFVRVFHWSLVTGFACAYLSAEFNVIDLHEIVGYGLIFLLLSRIVWGFIGSPYARFASFLFPLRTTLNYVQSLRSGEPAHYLGHNPLGAIMVFTLLLGLGSLFITGLITLAGIEFEGPLLLLANRLSDSQTYLIQNTHEIISTVMLVLIFLHVAGAISASIQHKENLILSMFTGRKRTQVNSANHTEEK
ncbi:MAG: cytochrome b/b6 domain-containing protein [Pseudomonadales bacterium]|nr:cytochrome b/b6 domain-containing protein [Pseudomonadales bacterium]